MYVNKRKKKTLKKKMQEKKYIRYDMDETRYRDVFRYDEGKHR